SRSECFFIARDNRRADLRIFGSGLQLGNKSFSNLQVKRIAGFWSVDAQKQNTRRRLLGKNHGHGGSSDEIATTPRAALALGVESLGLDEISRNPHVHGPTIPISG